MGLLLFPVAYIDWVIQGERRFYLRDIHAEDIADFVMTYFAALSLFLLYRYLTLVKKEELIRKGKPYIFLRFILSGLVVLIWETIIYFLYSNLYYKEPLTETSFFYNGVPMVILALSFLGTVLYIIYYGKPTASVAETGPVHDAGKNYAKEVIVVKGDTTIIVPATEIAYLFTKDKIVWLTTDTGSVYMLNQTLLELENTLDPSVFFRINRQLILSRKVIKGFSSESNQKLLVNFAKNENIYSEDAIVSKYNAPLFKQWISGAFKP